MKKRERIAVAVGAVLLVVGVVAGRERPAIELVRERTAERTAAVAAASDGIDLDKLHRAESVLPQTDPFKGLASVAPQASAPAKPVAPPLPFQYFGKLIENGKREVFVLRGEELLSLEAGKTYGEYRVDSVADTRIGFTYLPLKTKQTLEIQ